MASAKMFYADEQQRELYKKFPNSSFLGSEKNVQHFMLWVTFFRRNYHRFVTDVLGIKLYLYQIIWIYLMGISQFFVVIASRASAKSWMIALYACVRCILYPNSMVVLSSSTKNQSKLLISDKIQKDLMGRSPVLRKEIKQIVMNQNDMVVYFRNNSTIKVVPALDSARGSRSTVCVREEVRLTKRSIDSQVLSPFQIIRQPNYLTYDYYANIDILKEEPVDIYISSSWFDNNSEDSWMWRIVDSTYDEMLQGKPFYVLAFDESIALKHNLKSQQFFQTSRRNTDPISFRLEVLNERIKGNEFTFFNYEMLRQNQICKQPFYPRTTLDYLNNKKNPYDIPKQPGEIRIVSCDMAFVTKKGNDKSVFSCIRLLPESTNYKTDDSEILIDNGYRRILCYATSLPGGDIDMQATKIRQLYSDFQSDYIVLDTRNSGLAVFDRLSKVIFDEERRVEYPPLTCMNDENLASRIRSEGAIPCIFAINATQKMNSEIALDFRRVLEQKKIDLLVPFDIAQEEILPHIKEYENSPDADTQFYYEIPFLETQALINECIELTYDKKEQTGIIVVKEPSNGHKDHYSSVSYGSFFASKIEAENAFHSDDYEYITIVN